MSNIAWKLLITVLVVAWAVSAMMPFKSTQFEDYIATRATAHQEDFSKLLKTVEGMVDKVAYKTDPNKYPTLYIALRDYCNAKEIDLAKYFPDVNTSEILVLKKRNTLLLKELYRQSKSAIKQGLDLQGGVSFTLEINPDELSGDEFTKKGQIDNVLSVINNRVNGLGVTEPTIRAVGSNAIEVQMPGVSLKDNPEAIEELSRPAKLEFKVAHRYAVPSSKNPPASEIPVGYQLMIMEDENGGQVIERPMYIKRRAEATGEIIKRAMPRMDNANRYSISMEFTPDGAKQINKITKTILAEDEQTGTKQQLAIVLDGKLLCAPVIQGALGETGEITGKFSRREAIEIANGLNNPLAVGLKRTSLNEVGPSLAEDARDSSLMAAGVATVAVALFMLLYYFGFGLLAFFSVMVNIVIVVGVLASFGATFTLPGITALALTVAMAVDSNILIFERMREELKAGKSLPTALETGYSKAFSTIVDANLTTLLVAVILWVLGTGAIKGFGVTLAIGIFSTLFCALILSQSLLQIAVKYGIFTNSLHSGLLNNINFNFLSKAKLCYTISGVAVLASIAAICIRGEKLLGIDFTGGENLTIQFEQKVPLNGIFEMSTATSDESLGEIQASYQRDISTGKEYLSLQVEPEKGDRVFEALSAKFPNAKLKLIGTDSIGASVSSDITRNAFWSVGLALIGILLYVAVRFEFDYGVGALLSSIHDIVLTIGFYVILGMFGVGTGQFTAPMIASVLLVLGYSINDTIIVFDRIREELKLRPDMSLYDIVNLSINKTLTRTLITSGTTLIATVALFLLGTGVIIDFSLVFLVGIVVGTYSSIFIATPIFFWWHKGAREKAESREEIKRDWMEEPQKKKA